VKRACARRIALIAARSRRGAARCGAWGATKSEGNFCPPEEGRGCLDTQDISVYIIGSLSGLLDKQANRALSSVLYEPHVYDRKPYCQHERGQQEEPAQPEPTIRTNIGAVGLALTKQARRDYPQITRGSLTTVATTTASAINSATAITTKKRSVASRWTAALAATGHAPVTRGFLRNYSQLKPALSHGEAMFVIHLFDFKWDNAAPWPGYSVLAKYMGVSPKQVRRFAKSLEDKKYLLREQREAQTNRFHLDGLFQALEKLIAEGKARR